MNNKNGKVIPKLFWAIMMTANAAVMIMFAVVAYNSAKVNSAQKEYKANAVVRPTVVPPAPAPKAEKANEIKDSVPVAAAKEHARKEAAQYKIEESPEQVLTEEKPPVEKPKIPVGKDKALPVIFSYSSSLAQEVFIRGTFSVWQKLPMRKQGDKWTVTVYLFPGDYKYHFIVDGKKVLDPSADFVKDRQSVKQVGN